MQRGGALPRDASERAAITLVVFAGDTSDTRTFAAETGLALTRTILLPDPDVRVTNSYDAECPRAFVIDGNGVIRYTNEHEDDASRTAPALVIISRVISGLLSCVSASTPTSDAASIGLTVLAENNVESVKPTVGRYDFGQVDVLDMRSIEHTFVLRNDNKTPVELDHLGSSCGCASIFVGTADSPSSERAPDPVRGTARTTLAPGQKIAVRVSIDPSRLNSGSARKFVWVFIRGSAAPGATLEMTGKIQAPVTFSPPVLNFGNISAGTTSSLRLTATLDKRLLRAGQVPPLICTNPDVQIIPDSADRPGNLNAEKSAESRESASAAPAGRRTYTITVSPRAPLGILSGALSFVFVRAVPQVTEGTVPAQKYQAAGTASLIGAPAVLVGEVSGNVSAMPKTLVFGTVPAGQQALRQVTLAGSSTALRTLTVRCASSHLSARLVIQKQQGLDSPVRRPKHGAKKGPEQTQRSQVLEVILGSQAPPGILDTQVMVTLADGTRLVLPVFAYVTKASVQ